MAQIVFFDTEGILDKSYEVDGAFLQLAYILYYYIMCVIVVDFAV